MTAWNPKHIMKVSTNRMPCACIDCFFWLAPFNPDAEYFADMITAFAEVTSIQNYKANHTNADRIRSMTDEELAEWINTKNTWEQCAYEESACMKKLRVNGILRWLRSEAE